MFSFFKKKSPAESAEAPAPADADAQAQPPAPERGWREKLGFGAGKPAAPPAPEPMLEPAAEAAAPDEPAAERRSWFDKLRQGLRKTGTGIAQVFTGTQIDDALYEELEAALLMADAGVKAVGVNGAGKTTSIGKLTRHLAEGGEKVLLAAADTFRAAAREQLAIWAGRNNVEIVSQEGGDPSAVTFDAVVAGKARACSVVIADTAGRLPTQIHLMEELKKIKRTIAKAQDGAPHEVLLVVDGNTGQNALAPVRAFDDALQLTGLVVTKLDGTAKGGVLAAIARERPVPVYFIGVGEKLEDLETFDAREFASALLS